MHFIEANGAKIPAIGLGTWELRGRTCARIVEQALRLGYRHIDTAQVYENEREVGEGLRASGVRRDEVFLTTKVWTIHFAPNDLERSAKESLVRLRLTEVDLLLLHWPNPQVPLAETLGALAQVQAAWARPAYRRLEFHRGPDRGGGGGLPGAAGVRSGRVPSLSRPDQGEGGLRAAWHGAGRLQPDRQGPHQERPRAGADRRPLSQDAPRKSACAGWCSRIVAAIPRTSRLERLSENIEIFDFELSDEDMRQISAMGDAGGRLTDFGFAPKWD